MAWRGAGPIYGTAVAVPVAGTLSSFAVYLKWGFGGGHGPADPWIFWLQVPGVFIADRLPDSAPLWAALWVMPLLLNLLIFLFCGGVIHACYLGFGSRTRR